MRTATTLAWCLFIGLLTCTTTMQASPEYQWRAEPESETRTQAAAFFKLSSLPAESARVLYKTDIAITGDKVRESVKLVWFYPKQVDTENDGNGYIYWDQEVEKLIIREAGVVSPDGRYIRIDRDNVRVLDDDNYNTFTNTKVVIVPYSGLREGDVSVLEYEKHYSLSKLESNWSNSVYPILNNDTLNFAFSVHSDSIKLNSSQVGDKVRCQFGEFNVSCQGTNLKGYPRDSAVIWRDVIEQIYVSELFEWDEVVQASLLAFNKARLDSKHADELFSRLTRSVATIPEKIANIHHFVARDVRYISLSELGHRITPHTVASVDKNRFGDCKDKTAVLVAMLRRLGLSATPYLVATERKDPTRLITPSSGYFDHMIACFDYEGQRYCIDGTDTNTHWQTISSWIQNRVVLPLSAGSVPTTLAVTKPRWVLDSETELRFDGQAKQLEKQRRRYSDSYAGDVRGSLRHKNEADRQSDLVDQYHNSVSDSVVPKFTFKDVDTMGPSAEIISNVEYDAFLDAKEDLGYTERDHWLRYEFVNSKLQTEHYDTQFDGLEIESRFIIDTSELWNLTRLPASLDLKGRFGSMSRSVNKVDANKIIVETKALIPRQPVKQADIEAFNEYLDLLATESSINMQGVLIKKSSKR